jgi:acyl-coenzyme A synthetase/AMP-(fatty) acid ligase
MLGTTESSTVITTWSLDKRCDLSGSAGQLLPGITARVEKPDGTLAHFDEPGELVAKTPSLALGYAGNSKAYVDDLSLTVAKLMIPHPVREKPLLMGIDITSFWASYITG